MGYELERLVNEIDDEFLCSICTMVLENPMQSPCEHTFCNDCIKEWLSVQATCPVDACELTFNEIKPTPRYFRNMLAKVQIKCTFGKLHPIHHPIASIINVLFSEPNGCQAIVSLEEVQRHLSKCDFDPNAKVICHKECNIKIAILSEEVDRQKEEIAKLTEDLSRKLEQNLTLNDEVTRSANVIQSQQVEIKKHCDGVLHLLQGTMKVFNTLKTPADTIPSFKICENMTTYVDQPQILEHKGNGLEAFAQFNSSFEPSSPSFKLKVSCTLSDDLVIGLTRRGYSTQTSPGYKDRSVGFCSFGHAFVNGKRRNLGQPWGNGDIVECGIKFPNDFENDGNTDVEIYFTINDELQFSEMMKIPYDGFFPTVYMWSKGGTPKVEILNFF